MRSLISLLLLCLLSACNHSPSEEAPPALVDSSQKAKERVTSPGGQEADAGESIDKRMIIRRAYVQLSAADPQAVSRQAADIAKRSGGWVLSSQLGQVGEVAQELQIVLRVPEARLEAVLSKLRQLGKVREERQSGNDVTEEFVDTQARLKAERVLEKRLLNIAQGSAELKDLLAIEQELARVRASIEAKEGRARFLRESAQMATIEMTVENPRQAVKPPSQSLSSQFQNAVTLSLHLMAKVFQALLVALGFLLPLLLVAAPLYLIVRRWRRRSQETPA